MTRHSTAWLKSDEYTEILVQHDKKARAIHAVMQEREIVSKRSKAEDQGKNTQTSFNSRGRHHTLACRIEQDKNAKLQEHCLGDSLPGLHTALFLRSSTTTMLLSLLCPYSAALKNQNKYSSRFLLPRKHINVLS
jgi:hypothetical protein